MATTTPLPMGGQLLLTTTTVIYTVPNGATGIVRSITVVNTDSVARTFRLYIVPAGQQPGVRYALAYDFSLQPGDEWQDDAAHCMATGDSIIGTASVANVINCRADGAQVT